MVVEVKFGDILKAREEAIVNTVNCVGVMGAGLAKLYKHKYPDMFKKYVEWCKNEDPTGGDVFVYHLGVLFPPNVIYNVATKIDWRNPSEYWMVERGLDNIHYIAQETSIKSVALPFLGCGLGGLNKTRVLEMVVEEFQKSEVKAVIYLLGGGY